MPGPPSIVSETPLASWVVTTRVTGPGLTSRKVPAGSPAWWVAWVLMPWSPKMTSLPASPVRVSWPATISSLSGAWPLARAVDGDADGLTLTVGTARSRVFLPTLGTRPPSAANAEGKPGSP